MSVLFLLLACHYCLNDFLKLQFCLFVIYSQVEKNYVSSVFGRKTNSDYITHILESYPSVVVYDESGSPVSVMCIHTDGYMGIGILLFNVHSFFLY